MSMDQLHYKSITELSELYRRKEVLPSEVTEATLSRIGKLDGSLHGYAVVLAERAMAQARKYDGEIANGIRRGPLHGVPIGLKDLCYTTFAPSAGGTKIHAKFVPSFNATIVDRLERAGAVTLGKLKMTDGAYTSHHPLDQAPLNPWNVNYWVGSSSSGSGVATSAGLCYGSIGSDTGGSIRFPSATCGLTGINPTWGRVSSRAAVSSRWRDSLDHVGPMCRSAADAAAMLGVIAGADPNDPTALQAPVPNYLAGIGDGVRGTCEIGVDRKYTQDRNRPAGRRCRVAGSRANARRSRRGNPRGSFPSSYEKLVSQWIPMCSVETSTSASGDLSVTQVERIRTGTRAVDRAGQVCQRRRRTCCHSSRTAQVLRQPGGVVWGYRSFADPDYAPADPDAHQNGRIWRRSERSPEHSALHGGVRLLARARRSCRCRDGDGVGSDAAEHAIGRTASVRRRAGSRGARLPVDDGLAYAAASDRMRSLIAHSSRRSASPPTLRRAERKPSKRQWDDLPV